MNYKDFSKYIIMFLFILTFLVSAAISSIGSYITNTETTSLGIKYIDLHDGETYKIENDILSEFPSFGKTSVFGFSTRDFINKPLIIRSYESHDSEFELLTNYSVDNLMDQLFYHYPVISGEYNYLFNNYLDIHRNSLKSPFTDVDISNYNNWRDKIGHDPDNFYWFNIQRFGKKEEEIDLMVKIFGGGHSNFKGQQSWPLDFFHALIKEKIARDAIVQYFNSSYNNIEKKIPLSLKKEFLIILDELIVFLEKEIFTIKITRNDSEWYETDLDVNSKFSYFKSFLVRRIHTDKIPVLELKNHLKNIRNTITTSLPDTKVLNVFETIINNDIIIKDHSTSTLIISSLNSTKKVFIDNYEGLILKCLIDNGMKFYQFERKSYDKVEFLGLYNDKLDIIRSPSKK